MDRAAAQEAFSTLLSSKLLDAPQIRFVELIIDRLTARGVVEPGAHREELQASGPDGLFADRSE